jgi:hypothetical protein
MMSSPCACAWPIVRRLAQIVDYVSRQWRAPGIFNGRSGIAGEGPVRGADYELWIAVENQMALAFW